MCRHFWRKKNKVRDQKKGETDMNNWERMKAGRLYNADSKDLEQYHKFGMETCDKFNRTPLWMKKRKQRLLEKMIPSVPLR